MWGRGGGGLFLVMNGISAQVYASSFLSLVVQYRCIILLHARVQTTTFQLTGKKVLDIERQKYHLNYTHCSMHDWLHRWNVG